jgi:hypothetical protein
MGVKAIQTEEPSNLLHAAGRFFAIGGIGATSCRANYGTYCPIMQHLRSRRFGCITAGLSSPAVFEIRRSQVIQLLEEHWLSRQSNSQMAKSSGTSETIWAFAQ